MKIFTREELRALTAAPQAPCVSIYMPTHRLPTENQQDRTRLKNLIRQAHKSLLTHGLRPAAAESLLEPAINLLGPSLSGKTSGTAWRCSSLPGCFASTSCPPPSSPWWWWRTVFTSSRSWPFWAATSLSLALSQNEVRLFEGSRMGLSAIDDLEGVPKSLADALKYDDWSRTSSSAPPASGPAGPGATGRHVSRQAAMTPKEKSSLLPQIDQGLQDFLREEPAPLVLAGWGVFLPIYKEANTYPHLLGEGITGNPEGVNPDELHRQAWALVDRTSGRRRRRPRPATGSWRAPAGPPMTPGRSYPSHHGRVECLFVAVGRQQWGLRSGGQRSRPLPGGRAGSFDLLDLAATQTLLHGGAVFAVDASEVPGESLLAAVLRY